MSKKEEIIGNNMYIAKSRAIVNINGIEITTSEPLGIYLVVPIKRKLPGEPKIRGFREVVTGSKLIVRKKVNYETIDDITGLSSNYIKIEDMDASDHGSKIGGLAWEVVDKYPASEILSQEEIKKYLGKRPDAIYYKLISNILDAEKECEEAKNKEKVKSK